MDDKRTRKFEYCILFNENFADSAEKVLNLDVYILKFISRIVNWKRIYQSRMTWQKKFLC